MKSRITLSLTLILAAALPAAAQDRLEYNRDIRPILMANCFAYMGLDSRQPQGEPV
ncbi:MAG: hypothetical protein U0793_14565 [Gemmataceae bacterium]